MKHQKTKSDAPKAQKRVPKKKIFKKHAEITNNLAKNYGSDKKWYEELPGYDKEFTKLPDTEMIALKNEAKKCNDAEVVTYNIKNSKMNTDFQWMKTVMSKGIVSDKIAAHTILIQDDPICHLNTIYNLVNMVKVGRKKECLAVVETLAELFINDLLKPNAKLKSFFDQPLSKLSELSSGNNVTKNKYLSIWYFEDQLKEYYTTFVQALNTAAHDTVEANKEKAIGAMYKLLAGNPEQEKNLLSHIVNKLGDPSQKVASKVIYCLGQLIYHHPNMKQVVLNEIERLLFRPNISTKAQYYSICFLTQFYLSHEDFELAKNLIMVYFSFFKGLVKKGDVDTRMMSALLMGVNRAYPFAKYNLTDISQHIDTMYKVVHVATFNVSLHALNLLYQISDHNNSINDRFYTALYKKLLDYQIGSTTHQAIMLNLLYRSLKRDVNVNRVRAFIKRLLQVAIYMQPPMACSILYMVNQLMHKKNTLQALIYNPNTIIDDNTEGEHYDDVKLEEDAEVKTETDEEATQKDKGPPTVDKTIHDLTEEKPKIDLLNVIDPKSESSWFHVNKTIKSEFNHEPITCYSSIRRNPLYAGGEFCVYTELLQLQKHYHPTVALFASKIVKSENISYSGDPLKDFTLIRFVERFAFKNPKKVEDVQKAGVNPVFGKRKMYTAPGIKSVPVNSASYINEAPNRIPVDEIFMHTYLQRKNEEQKANKKSKDDDDDSDGDSVASDEFEAMLDKMSGSKKLDDDDDDLDFMHEIGDSLKNASVAPTAEDEFSPDEDISDEDESDDNEDDDQSDGDNDFGDEDIDDVDDNEEGFDDVENDLNDDLDDEDESDIQFGSDSEDEGPPKSKKSKKSKETDLKKVFANADDFAAFLEDDDLDIGKDNAVLNKDHSNKKQLAWESKKSKSMRKTGNSSGKKKNKSFNQKRPNQGNFGNKSKKRKH